MRQFFHLKISETLLLNMLLAVTVLFISCASPKNASVHRDTAETVVEAARKFIGTPYKYGGTTRAGMDCSGLLLNSFRSINVELARSSEDQSKMGKEVSMNELLPGDLVFFATGKRRKKITHVGLVTEIIGKDNVKFIHSSSALGVVETNLFAEYYQKRFITARRIIE
jgi:probable lipoprotein NlpC